MACTTAGEFYIDDTLIDQLFIDDQEIDGLYIDDICVWVALQPGEIIFDVPGNYTWTIPNGMREVNLDMVAAGGAGSVSAEEANSFGGYAGECFIGTESVTPGDTIDISVGEGGVVNFSSITAYISEIIECILIKFYGRNHVIIFYPICIHKFRACYVSGGG